MTYTFEPFTIEALGTTFRVRPYANFGDHGNITLARIEPDRDAEHNDVPFTINKIAYVGTAYVNYRDDWGLTLDTEHIHRPPYSYAATLTEAASKAFRTAMQPALDKLREPNGDDVLAILASDVQSAVYSAIGDAVSKHEAQGYRLTKDRRWAGQVDNYSQRVKDGAVAGIQQWMQKNNLA